MAAARRSDDQRARIDTAAYAPDGRDRVRTDRSGSQSLRMHADGAASADQLGAVAMRIGMEPARQMTHSREPQFQIGVMAQKGRRPDPDPRR